MKSIRNPSDLNSAELKKGTRVHLKLKNGGAIDAEFLEEAARSGLAQCGGALGYFSDGIRAKVNGEEVALSWTDIIEFSPLD